VCLCLYMMCVYLYVHHVCVFVCILCVCLSVYETDAMLHTGHKGRNMQTKPSLLLEIFAGAPESTKSAFLVDLICCSLHMHKHTRKRESRLTLI